MRKLAHIETITDIQSIPGADRIEKVLILGWEVVVKKGQFKVGDKVCYCEIDSILPPRKEFEFLEHRKYRVRTIRLKKQTSQGIVFSLEEVNLSANYPIGKDVTKELGIVKHNPQATKEGIETIHVSKNPIHKYMLRYSWYRNIQPKKKGKWPAWIPKTDEERVNNLPSMVNNNQNMLCYASEKCDGMSASYSLKVKKKLLLFNKLLFAVCSRNIWLKRPNESAYWRVANKYKIEENLKKYYKKYGKELLIQGEILGEGIQKNKYAIPAREIEFRVFNVINITDNIWYGEKIIPALCIRLGLIPVPIVWSGRLRELGETPIEIVAKAEGKSVLNKNIQREGIVIRQHDSSYDKKGLSFKAINNKFLLKYEDDE